MPPSSRPPRPPLSPDVLEARRVRETMEREIIFGMMRSYRFYQQMRDVICVYDPERGAHRMDFSVNRYNTLFRAIDAFYRRFDGVRELAPTFQLHNVILANTIVDWANNNGVDLTSANELLAEIQEEKEFTNKLDLESLTALTQGPAFQDWLTSRVLEQTVGKVQAQKGLGTLTLSNLEEMVANARLAVRPLNNTHFYNGANIVRGSRILSPYVPIPNMPRLNAAIGRGLFWGDTTMFAAINGGGKTIVCMQLAKDLAKAGYRVAVFTTERHPDEMLIRAVANELDIELDQFTPNLPLDQHEQREIAYIPDHVWNNPRKRAQLEDLEAIFTTNLLMVDWSRGQGYSIESHFDSDIAQMERMGWSPQIILFDWIGGGLDNVVKDKLRLYYEAAANFLANHGKRTGRIMIEFAQLDKNLVKPTTPWIDMSMLSECKTMTNLVTNFIGLTALRDKNPRPGSPALQRLQNMCVAKATRGPTGNVRYEAAYAFQKIMEVNTIAGGGGG